MKIGNTSINVLALEAITKEEFIEMNKGKIMNVETEAEKLSKYFKKEQAGFSIKEVLDSAEEEKPNRRRRRKSK